MCRRDEPETWQSIGGLAYEILERVGEVRRHSRREAGSAAHTRLAANDNNGGMTPVAVGKGKGVGAEATHASWPGGRKTRHETITDPTAAAVGK